MAISHCYWYLVVQNGNFTLLLTSSGPEWQFHIATHVQWSRMTISHCYWHLMVKNGNLTFLLLEFILADQLADLPTSLFPQLSIDALNTTTPNLQHLMADLSIYRQCIYPWQMDPHPSQLSIDALNTATPDLAHLITDLCIYRQCTYTQCNQA